MENPSNALAVGPQIDFFSEQDGKASERSLVDDVYDQLLMRIIRGDLKSGEVLICTKLAEELGFSRTPVVSAIDRLVGEGILVKEINRRARVREGAESWLLQIHQLREIVEPPAAALAAQHITPQSVEKLQQLAEWAAPGETNNWQMAAREFDFMLHLTIADSCQNIPLQESIYKCWKYKRFSYELGCADPEIEEMGYREHLAILSALSQRDSETAKAAMLFHLRASFCNSKRHQVI